MLGQSRLCVELQKVLAVLGVLVEEFGGEQVALDDAKKRLDGVIEFLRHIRQALEAQTGFPSEDPDVISEYGERVFQAEDIELDSSCLSKDAEKL